VIGYFHFERREVGGEVRVDEFEKETGGRGTAQWKTGRGIFSLGGGGRQVAPIGRRLLEVRVIWFGSGTGERRRCVQ